MRKTVLGLSGGALPVVAGISVFTVLAGTLAVVDWTVVSPGTSHGDLHLAPLPRTAPLAGSALDGPAQALLRAGDRVVAAERVTRRPRPVVRVVTARPARAGLPARQVAPRPAPGVITPPVVTPSPSPTPGAAPTPVPAPTPATPPATVETRAAAPLSGVGTIAAVAAENTTEALGSIVSDVTSGVGRALPVLQRPLVQVGALVKGTLTGAGRLVGGLLRGLTGAAPRAADPPRAP